MLRSDHQPPRDIVNQTYTGDEGHGGWYVPTYWRSEIADYPSLGLLNLLSPFYDNREQAKDRLEEYCRRQLATIDIPTPPPPPTSTRLNRPSPSWDPTLPFITRHEYDWFGRVRILFDRGEVLAQGAITVLALAAYRNDHGRFPESLDELVPRYLQAMPMDPFASQPLRYKLDTEEGYRLYSVSEDGKDDGGVVRDAGNRPLLDHPIRRKREPAKFNEWFLVPAGTTTRAASDINN